MPARALDVPDTIHISRLELFLHIGVPDEERAAAQRLTVSLTLEPARDFRALGDDIVRTVDYFSVCEAVKTLAGGHPRRLIETLAEDIAAHLLERFALTAVEVDLRKYILPDTEYVGVRIRRTR